MVWSVKDSNRQYQYFAIISVCSYTWVGMSNLLTQQDIYPIRVMHHGEEINAEEKMIMSEEGQAQLAVFLNGDICAILTTLKKLVLLLDYSTTRNDVTIFSQLPACWLYGTLFSLLNNKSKLQCVHLGFSGLACHSIIDGHFPLLEFAAKRDIRPGFCLDAGLSVRELNAVLHYYQGYSVKYQSLLSGLAGKTIYTHRQHGMKKLSGLQQWLNDAAMTRELNRRRRNGVLRAVSSLF